MRIKEDIRPVTFMKTSAAELLRTLEENRRPVVITQNGAPKGVLLDVDSYERLRDASLMLKVVAQGEADFEGGRTVSQDEVFSTLRERYRTKG